MKLIPVDSHDELLQLIVAIARSSHTGLEFERALNREITRESYLEIPQVASPTPSAEASALDDPPSRDGPAVSDGDGSAIKD